MGELAVRCEAIDHRRKQSRKLLQEYLAGQAAVARQVGQVRAQRGVNLLRLNGFIYTVVNPGTNDLAVACVFQAGDEFLEGVRFDVSVVGRKTGLHRFWSKKRSKSVTQQRRSCQPNLGNVVLTQ